MFITDLIVTPVAFRDPPLLNVWGTHEPFALRVVLQLVTGEGVVGLGEAPGGRLQVDRLRLLREHILGQSVFSLGRIEALTHRALGYDTSLHDRLAVFAAVEVACLDAQGRLLNQPVSDLLGGAVRDRVDYSGYLFYKWAGHPLQEADTGTSRMVTPSDKWGEALDADGLIAQAGQLIDEFGFRSLKLKGGVFAPNIEIDAVKALHEAFPDRPLRFDPNGAWTVETSLYAAQALEGQLEYLEDPTPGMAGMAAVAARTEIPLATNMCVTSFDDLPSAIETKAVAIVLGDHHAWGGMRRVRDLGRICETWGLGLSMHSNSHLGISLAAMTHLAAVSPMLGYACDTHYPWNAAEDVIVGDALSIEEGAVMVPTTPGLGVELDESRLQVLHEQYLAWGSEARDDTGYRRAFEPEFNPSSPRW
jgi:glucarate dehydratase